STTPIRQRRPRAPLLFSSLVAELEGLEAVQLFLDQPLVGTRAPGVQPVPGLDQKLAGRAVRLEVESGDHLIAQQYRQYEVAEPALGLGHIGLEDVVV